MTYSNGKAYMWLVRSQRLQKTSKKTKARLHHRNLVRPKRAKD